MEIRTSSLVQRRMRGGRLSCERTRASFVSKWFRVPHTFGLRDRAGRWGRLLKAGYPALYDRWLYTDACALFYYRMYARRIRVTSHASSLISCRGTMIIPITLKPPPSDGRTLPPQLANLGNGDIVLIELQGSLEVQGSTDSQFVGTLEIDPKTVCALLATIMGPRSLTRTCAPF